MLARVGILAWWVLWRGVFENAIEPPAVVIGIDPVTGIGKGSGRSQPGVNLGRAVQAAYDAGLLLAGGGHAMAAGLTVKAEMVPELRAFLTDCLAIESQAAVLADELQIDALAAPGPAGRALWEAFQSLAPFGPGAPEPMVAVADVRIEQARSMGGGHVRCQLTTAAGARMRAVAWRCEDTALGRRLLSGGGALHVAGRLKADDWGGRSSVELEIDDAADPRQSENCVK